MATATVSGAKTLAQVDADNPGFFDKTDARSWKVGAADILQFDTTTTTTLTIDNQNLTILGEFKMLPASAAVIHTVQIDNVVDANFVGGQKFSITAVSGTGTSRTLTLVPDVKSERTVHN